MMDRRAFLAGTLAVLGGPLLAAARPAAKVHRIGYLQTAPRASSVHMLHWITLI